MEKSGKAAVSVATDKKTESVKKTEKAVGETKKVVNAEGKDVKDSGMKKKK
jgi:hypothetical protein